MTINLINLDNFFFSVPYNEISAESGLVAMFGQVGAVKCKCVLAAGGIAGLTVSMFGSMFPMPRIVYAMAHDGLIFRFILFHFVDTKSINNSFLFEIFIQVPFGSSLMSLFCLFTGPCHRCFPPQVHQSLPHLSVVQQRP